MDIEMKNRITAANVFNKLDELCANDVMTITIGRKDKKVVLWKTLSKLIWAKYKSVLFNENDLDIIKAIIFRYCQIYAMKETNSTFVHKSDQSGIYVDISDLSKVNQNMCLNYFNNKPLSGDIPLADTGCHHFVYVFLGKFPILYNKEISGYRYIPLYVGSSAGISSRLSSHIHRNGFTTSQDVLDRVYAVLLYPCNSKADMLYLEEALIALYKPEFNKKSVEEDPPDNFVNNQMGFLYHGFGLIFKTIDEVFIQQVNELWTDNTYINDWSLRHHWSPSSDARGCDTVLEWINRESCKYADMLRFYSYEEIAVLNDIVLRRKYHAEDCNLSLWQMYMRYAGVKCYDDKFKPSISEAAYCRSKILCWIQRPVMENIPVVFNKEIKRCVIPVIDDDTSWYDKVYDQDMLRGTIDAELTYVIKRITSIYVVPEYPENENERFNKLTLKYENAKYVAYLKKSYDFWSKYLNGVPDEIAFQEVCDNKYVLKDIV